MGRRTVAAVSGPQLALWAAGGILRAAMASSSSAFEAAQFHSALTCFPFVFVNRIPRALSLVPFSLVAFFLVLFPLCLFLCSFSLVAFSLVLFSVVQFPCFPEL